MKKSKKEVLRGTLARTAQERSMIYYVGHPLGWGYRLASVVSTIIGVIFMAVIIKDIDW